MVPRVKLAYDHVRFPSPFSLLPFHPSLFLPPPSLLTPWSHQQRVYDIIHPSRRNLTAIRGYVRLGGLPDNPRTDPQDRSWFGPHDRLFTEEESEEVEFVPGPEHGMLFPLPSTPSSSPPFVPYTPFRFSFDAR